VRCIVGDALGRLNLLLREVRSRSYIFPLNWLIMRCIETLVIRYEIWGDTCLLIVEDKRKVDLIVILRLVP
jgi:hypothetical protein